MDIPEVFRREASRALGRAVARIMSSDPREAAEFAFVSGGPSVDQLEVMVRKFQKDHTKKPGAVTPGQNTTSGKKFVREGV